MTLTPSQLFAFNQQTADFGGNHERPLERIRRMFNIPENRYFTVNADNGKVTIDHSRTRIVERRKISKSDQG